MTTCQTRTPAAESRPNAIVELEQLRESGVPLLPVKVPGHYRRLVDVISDTKLAGPMPSRPAALLLAIRESHLPGDAH